MHDLSAILAEVLTHFAREPRSERDNGSRSFPMRTRFVIDWIDLDEVEPEWFKEKREYACVTRVRGVWCIGIHPRLRRAPKRVIRYLIMHEVLHVALGCWNHPHMFGVAERLWPDYQWANAWLARFYRRKGL